jgi:phosphohistidine swiveling domain-containing protein
MARYIYHLKDSARCSYGGAKAASLLWLLKRGYPIPETWVCSWQAFETKNNRDREQLEAELSAIFNPQKRYAVRSSANLEDAGDVSFAGQFTSVLSVQGLQELLAAVAVVSSSTEKPKVRTYLQAHGIAAEKLKMGVVIQEMVSPQISGVCFSRNPVTGLDEIVVEAVEGRGDLLLQEGYIPHRWTYKWGSFIQTPDNPGASQSVIEKVIRDTRRIEEQFGKPVDVEWVFDGTSIYLVQVRPIGQVESFNIYSNRISREFLPGQIKPLVWSINVPLVNGAWIGLFHKLIGPTSLQADQLARAFYYRAYFNMGAVGSVFEKLGFPRESLELLMGIEGGKEKPRMRPSWKALRYLPRLFWFLGTKLWYRKTVDRALQEANEAYLQLLQVPLADLGDEQVVERVDMLFGINKRLAFHNIVAPLFMSLFSRLLQRKFNKHNIQFEQFDLKAGVEELKNYDPNPTLQRLREQLASLPEHTQEVIRSSTYRQLPTVQNIDGFRTALSEFLHRFGHLSDSSNDFSIIPWRENPDLVLKLICEHSEPAETGRTSSRKTLPALSRSMLRAVGRTQKLLSLKESVSFTYTYGYGLFRDLFLHLGERWAEKGHLGEREDILYLNLEEIRALAVDRKLSPPPQQRVRQRRSAMENCRDVELPEIIYGDEEPSVDRYHANHLRGTATSRGYYTGPANVIRSVEEFSKLKTGDVLIISHSDVAWTALFSKAGAVVSEAGGLLSHSSIVAREYNIPCVVGVTGATNLNDGTMIAVDGYIGSVRVLEQTK